MASAGMTGDVSSALLEYGVYPSSRQKRREFAERIVDAGVTPKDVRDLGDYLEEEAGFHRPASQIVEVFGQGAKWKESMEDMRKHRAAVLARRAARRPNHAPPDEVHRPESMRPSGVVGARCGQCGRGLVQEWFCQSSPGDALNGHFYCLECGARHTLHDGAIRAHKVDSDSPAWGGRTAAEGLRAIA